VVEHNIAWRRGQKILERVWPKEPKRATLRANNREGNSKKESPRKISAQTSKQGQVQGASASGQGRFFVAREMN